MKELIYLPQEIQRMILVFLEPPYRSPGKPDLLACALVCRLWYQFVLPILYRQFWFDIVAPPAPDDRLKRYLAAPSITSMRELHLFISSGLQMYTTPAQCDEIQAYLRRIIHIIDATTNLSYCELDLIPFAPGDCLPNLWARLCGANTLLVELVRTVVHKRPRLHLCLGRPEFLAEAQVLTIWLPLFESMFAEAEGHFRALRIGCPLNWLLRWLRENPKLRELYYTTTAAAQEYQISEFWDVFGKSQIEKLMLDGFRFPSVHKLPVELVMLILTHLDNTVTATNAILTHLPNLRLLSLRLEEIQDGDTDREPMDCVEGKKVVCRSLRKVWWTKSSAPERAVSVLGHSCSVLESVSPPLNVTDGDLVALSTSAKYLSEIWLLDCPKITQVGLRSLRNLRRLRYIQLEIPLAPFLAEATFKAFLQKSQSLKVLAVVFVGTAAEEARRQEFARLVTGEAEYHEQLFRTMTFQSFNLGDKFMFDISRFREIMG